MKFLQKQKVSSRFVDVQQKKKITKEVIFLASCYFFIIVDDKFTQYYMYQEANGISMVCIYGIYLWYISGSFPALF